VCCQLTEAVALAELEDALRYSANAIPPGFRRQWEFVLPDRLTAESPLFLQYKFSCSRNGDDSIMGMWRAGPDTAADVFREVASGVPGGVYSLQIPRSAVISDPDSPLPGAGVGRGQRLFVEVKLFYGAGSFEMNFLRVLLVLLIQLSFLAAVGLTAGACFSMPVATFFSGWVVLLLSVSGYLQSMAAETSFSATATRSGLIDLYLASIFKILNMLVRPLETPRILEMLSGGELVSWGLVASSFVIKTVFYGGVLALLSAWILSRREIALPTRGAS